MQGVTDWTRTRLKNSLARMLRAPLDSDEYELVAAAAGKFSAGHITAQKGVGVNSVKYMIRILNNMGYQGEVWYHTGDLREKVDNG